MSLDKLPFRGADGPLSAASPAASTAGSTDISNAVSPPRLRVEEQPALTGRRILVVESEVEAADQLARLMEELGHVVQLAADAKTALFELHDFNPHLVLLGTYLADMPGYELSAILHGAPQYSQQFRHVGLLFVADRHKLLKHRFIGAPDVPIARYIFKPLDPFEVREKVSRTLRAGVM